MPRLGSTPDHERRQRVLALRAEGLTFAEIGKRLGVTHQAAQKMATRVPKCGAAEACCRACNAVIAPGVLVDKKNQGALCLACLAKQPQASFSDRLKAFRMAAGLTRVELARRSGLHRCVIDHHESKQCSDPRWSRLRRLVEVLGVDLLGLEQLSPPRDANAR